MLKIDIQMPTIKINCRKHFRVSFSFIKKQMDVRWANHFLLHLHYTFYILYFIIYHTFYIIIFDHILSYHTLNYVHYHSYIIYFIYYKLCIIYHML